MELVLTDSDENSVNVSVPDDDWVAAASEACWAWLRRTGTGSVTAREAGGANAGARICTVTYELHDE